MSGNQGYPHFSSGKQKTPQGYSSFCQEVKEEVMLSCTYENAVQRLVCIFFVSVFILHGMGGVILSFFFFFFANICAEMCADPQKLLMLDPMNITV